MNGPRSPALQRVFAGDLCAGCGMCAGISGGAITMATSPSGFARPVQHRPLDDDAERTVAEACPALVVAPWPVPDDDRNLVPDPIWGPSRRVATGHALDPELRFAGASGGALSALLCHALESGLVDAVLHVEADEQEPLGNRMRWSRTPQEVLRGSGSRYAPSSPLEWIDEALASGERFAFVGKPCDVSALRMLARRDARVGRNVPIVLSFYCGGLPSLRGAARVVAAMGLHADEVAAFRYRGQGWPGPTRAVTRDGEERSMTYAESWGRHLSREVQFRCKICPDAIGGAADIACADAWFGDEDGYPAFEEEDGRSLIHARTAAGEALLESALAAGALRIEAADPADIHRMQPFQARRKRAIRSRLAACRVLSRPIPETDGTCVEAAARQATIWETARSFLGLLRRLHRDRNKHRTLPHTSEGER